MVVLLSSSPLSDAAVVVLAACMAALLGFSNGAAGCCSGCEVQYHRWAKSYK